MVTSTARTPLGRVYGSWGVFTLTAPSLGPGPSKKTPRREAPCGACLALRKSAEANNPSANVDKVSPPDEFRGLAKRPNFSGQQEAIV